MVQPFSFARTRTTHILVSFHALLIASLLFGTLANATVPQLSLTHSRAQWQIKANPKPNTSTMDIANPTTIITALGKHTMAVTSPISAQDAASVIDPVGSHNLNHNDATKHVPSPVHSVTLKKVPTQPTPTKLCSTKQVIARQVHPTFHCAAYTGHSNCAGATDCLFADPKRCNTFIECDANYVAWEGCCPLESMVWDDEKKMCDYAKEKRVAACHKEGRGNIDEEGIAMVPADHPIVPLNDACRKNHTLANRSTSAAASMSLGDDNVMCVTGVFHVIGLIVAGFGAFGLL